MGSRNTVIAGDNLREAAGVSPLSFLECGTCSCIPTDHWSLHTEFNWCLILGCLNCNVEWYLCKQCTARHTPFFTRHQLVRHQRGSHDGTVRTYKKARPSVSSSESFLIMDEQVTTEVDNSSSKPIDDQQDNVESPVQNCNQLLVSKPSQLSNTIDFNMF
jgi:hypothetical protein